MSKKMNKTILIIILTLAGCATAQRPELPIRKYPEAFKHSSDARCRPAGQLIPGCSSD